MMKFEIKTNQGTLINMRPKCKTNWSVIKMQKKWILIIIIIIITTFWSLCHVTTMNRPTEKKAHTKFPVVNWTNCLHHFSTSNN